MPQEMFHFDSAAAVAGWSAIDDRVMGGISSSHLRFDEAGWAVFEGNVSLERNGGFASVRSRPCAFQLAGVSAFRLEVKGDGKRYKLNLRTDDAFDGVNYQAVFAPPAGQWLGVELPLAAFQATFRGRVVSAAEPLDPAQVRQVGLMIAERQSGPFSLALRAIGVR
jgi:hypothetical protein